MFFRLAAAIGILTAIALAAIALEKQNLSLKRSISLQHYQLQRLQEKRCRLVLRTEELASPARLLESWEARPVDLEPLESAPRKPETPPLLEWRLSR